MILSGNGYRCSGGETFDSVALEVYGDERYAAELLCANPELCTATVFCGGEILLLPVVEIPEAGETLPAEAPWKER